MIDEYNKTKLMTLINQAKWDIVDFIGKKYGFEEGWGNCSIEGDGWSAKYSLVLDEKDKDCLTHLSDMDEAIEYYSEYKDGNFEVDRFFAKFQNFFEYDHEIMSINSAQELLDFKKHLMEVYHNGDSLR